MRGVSKTIVAAVSMNAAAEANISRKTLSPAKNEIAEMSAAVVQTIAGSARPKSRFWNMKLTRTEHIAPTTAPKLADSTKAARIEISRNSGSPTPYASSPRTAPNRMYQPKEFNPDMS